jgi:cell division protein FtsW (lipid II flippase)
MVCSGAAKLSKERETRRMKLNVWYLVALIPLALLASSGALGTQLAVLGLTLGIFFGTVSLRRPQAGDATTTNPGH